MQNHRHAVNSFRRNFFYSASAAEMAAFSADLSLAALEFAPPARGGGLLDETTRIAEDSDRPCTILPPSGETGTPGWPPLPAARPMPRARAPSPTTFFRRMRRGASW